MTLLVGPPGSGKTQQVLDQARSRLAQRRWDFRLIVPTATMAEHLRNELAREGYVFRPEAVTTLSRFVARWVDDSPEPSEARLVLAVRRALDAISPRVFQTVARFAGFESSLARAIAVLSSAGCDAAALRAIRSGAASPVLSALAEVYAETERMLGDDGFLLRGARFRKAAARIEAGGLPGISEILLDGFFAFSEPELAIVQAAARHAALTVSLPEWRGSEPVRGSLLARGFREQRLARLRPYPRVSLVTAPSPDQELSDIARRILQEAAAGRPFREMAVIVRSAGPVAAALETTLARFGIPVRSYFGRRLAHEAVIRFFSAVVEALLSDWDHEKVLAAVMMTASGAGRRAGTDRFEFDVLGRIPGRGLEPLRGLARVPGVRRFLDKLEQIGSWRDAPAPPAEWRSRFAALADLFRPEPPEGGESHEVALLWRRQAMALEAYHAALEEAASALPAAHPVTLAEFWNTLTAVFQATTLHRRDERRNVAHLLDAYEARQWALPVVFVCNLVEGEFPVHHTEDPVLDEETRRALNAAGYRVPAAADREEEERFLWQMVVSRATSKLVLSWSRYNAQGDENLRSFLLDEFLAHTRADEEAVEIVVRPRPFDLPRHPRRVHVTDASLRSEIARKNSILKPTGVEDFLQCPFLFFARHTLGLEGPPEPVADRLGFAARGEVAHRFLERWAQGERDFETLFETVFEEWVENRRIPRGYACEAVRVALARDLKQFVGAFHFHGFTTTGTERRFEFALADGVRIRGRIDRLDSGPDGDVLIVDYKYVKPDGIRRRIKDHEAGRLVQAGLYLLAAGQCWGRRVAGVLLAGVRDKPTWKGWHTPLSGLGGAGQEDLHRLGEIARERTVEAFARIRAGWILPNPADPDDCEHCAFRDVCRVEVAAPAVAAAAEEMD
ncbi:MAG: PD-(D/E)XK nuclease family protein [Bryobacteraceae bacterium]|jgi:ATP-dependent helicase/DNAse subunit B|nr:PD-(D/E)XK nuclease family protein [Bryobacteraceae bacterium]